MRAAASASRRDLPLGDIHPVKLKPLNDDDVRIVHALAATRSVTAAMDAAWNDSDRTGRENGLFIYKDGDRYYPGEIIHGVPGKMTDAFYANLQRPDPLRGRFAYAVAVFHTHPDKYAAAKRPDNYDQNFGKRATAITIIQTGHHEYAIGR